MFIDVDSLILSSLRRSEMFIDVDSLILSSLRRSEMFIDVDSLIFLHSGRSEMWTVPNIALLTECRLLSDSSAINMSLLRSEEQEETIRFHLRHNSALRDFLMESFDRFQLASLALICLKNEAKADAERDLRN